MRLDEFIERNVNQLVQRWAQFSHGSVSAQSWDEPGFVRYASTVLRGLARDVALARASAGSTGASASTLRRWGDARDGAWSRRRVQTPRELDLDVLQVLAEHRWLRAAVLREWRESRPAAHVGDIDDIITFNASVDELMHQCVAASTRRVEHARDTFLAILGHDLRNPLQAISVSAGMIALTTSGVAGIRKYCQQITSSVFVINSIVSDLLDFARTRLGSTMPLDPVATDLAAVCEDVVDEFRHAYPDRTFRLNVAGDGDGAGVWDERRMRQALSNLVKNAVQYGDAGSSVDVTFRGGPRSVQVDVHNEGRAINPVDRVRLFDPLVRGTRDSATDAANPSGVGLGLYIAREIVHSHGGRIELDSRPGEGTTFRVHLPRDGESVDPPAPVTEASFPTVAT